MNLLYKITTLINLTTWMIKSIGCLKFRRWVNLVCGWQCLYYKICTRFAWSSYFWSETFYWQYKKMHRSNPFEMDKREWSKRKAILICKDHLVKSPKTPWVKPSLKYKFHSCNLRWGTHTPKLHPRVYIPNISQ